MNTLLFRLRDHGDKATSLSAADDPRGESCLVLGFFAPDGRAVHVVCGRGRSGHLVLITVYCPTMPKWRDPRTRNR